MLPVRDAILECLQLYSNDDDSIIRELHRISDKFGAQTYSILLHILTHLSFEAKDAESIWKKIIHHWKKLEETLNRKVSLRTAICDFFCSVDRSLKNPKVIEIQVFEETTHSSKFDSVTGLFNRGFFDDALQRELARAKRHNVPLSILFFDLDDFKKVNDTYGHLGGDATLKSVSKVINEEKRTEDLAARYGGEEMILILPDTEKTQALVLGERIRKRVSETITYFAEKSISITLSGGLACFPVDTEEAAQLLDCADKALYLAKNAGKNNIALYSENKHRYFQIDDGLNS
tara:strand:- start:1591 stop:2460 length:870 start_codon:yes stop_codon:yes gene_type:complete